MIVECEEVTFKGLLSCFEVGDEVTKFLLLVLEGLDKVSVQESELKVSEDFDFFFT